MSLIYLCELASSDVPYNRIATGVEPFSDDVRARPTLTVKLLLKQQGALVLLEFNYRSKGHFGRRLNVFVFALHAFTMEDLALNEHSPQTGQHAIGALYVACGDIEEIRTQKSRRFLNVKNRTSFMITVMAAISRHKLAHTYGVVSSTTPFSTRVSITR